MKILGRNAAILAILALTATGCGGGSGDDDKKTPEPATNASKVKAATGKTLKTKDFSYSAPEGWEDITKQMPGAVTGAGNVKDTDGFADNVNVLRLDPAPISDIDKLEDASEKELTSSNATDVKILDRADVDGSPAVHVTAGFSVNGNNYLIEQYNVIHDDVSYVVTFSFSPTVTEAEQQELSESVLNSWAWAS